MERDGETYEPHLNVGHAHEVIKSIQMIRTGSEKLRYEN